jgi:Family of unknown function (DUF6049)
VNPSGLRRFFERGPAALAVTAALLGPVLAFPATPAAAQDRSVEVVIERFGPQVPATADTTLSLTGRIVNTGRSPVDKPAVGLRVSVNRIVHRDDLRASAAAGGTHIGNLVDGTQQELPGTLQPGASLPWSISVPVRRLNLPLHGAYSMGVEARVNGERVGLTKTFLPWVPAGSRVEPTKIVMLWPVVDRPRIDANGLFTDDGLARDLTPQGRLGRLVSAGAGLPVTWVLDPDLLQTVADMADGYEVGHVTAHKPGRGAGVAAQWLQSLRTATAGDVVLALPYADPDVLALQHNGRGADIPVAIREAAERAPKLLGRSVRTDVAWPAGNHVDDRTLSSLRRAGASAVVVDDAAVPLAEELTFTPTGRAELTVDRRRVKGLLADSAITELLASDQSGPGAPALVGQQFLAETTMITEEHPGDPRIILVTPPRRWNPDPRLLAAVTAAVRQAPWLVPGSLADLEAALPPAVRREPLVYPDAARRAELAAAQVQNVDALARRLRRYQSILARPGAVGGSYAPAILRAESSAWRSGRQGFSYELTVRRGLERLEREVRIISRDTVTLSAKRGKIPITVTNDSKQEVTVGLRMESTVSRRLSMQPVPKRTIKPEHKVTFDVPATAVANGIVAVTAQLETPSGQPYGERLTLRVRATNYGSVGLVVVGGAVSVLFAIVAVRLFRRARAAAADHAGRTPEKVTVPE